MKSNKGYTLVELLMAVATFSIVMVVIFGVMNNTAKSYTKANLDIAVQEDAQLVANQLEELLCDASSINMDGSNYVVNSLDDSGNKVKYTIKYSDNKILLNDTKKDYVLADDVVDFALEGFGTSGKPLYDGSGSDNKTSIHIELKNQDSSYELDRTVYFRNNVEDNSFKSIDKLATIKDVKKDDDDDKIPELDVKRYEEYNLTSLFSITDDCHVYMVGGDGKPDTGSEDTAKAYFKIKEEKDVLIKDVKSYYLSCSDGMNAEFSENGTLGTKKVMVVGNSGKIKVLLGVKKVQINQDVLIQGHGTDGKTVNSEGFASPVVIDGININEASKKKTIKYTVEIKGDETATFKEDTMSTVTTGIVNADNQAKDRQTGTQCKLGVSPDPFNGGVFVLFNNFGMQYFSGSSKMTIDMTIKVGDDSISGTLPLSKMGGALPD